MKIKGPADYSGPPAPPEPEKGGSGEGVVSPGRLAADQVSPQQQAETVAAKGKSAADPARQPDAFEMELRDIARTVKDQGLHGEATAAKVVDRVLEDVMGKEFMSGPRGVEIRQAIGPLVSQDDHLMAKLNSILSRLENKKQ